MKPFIVGVEGKVLTNTEIRFLKQEQPWGIILFARNCEHPQQLKALTDSLRDVLNRPFLPILIDQEGGRVARLKAPLWRTYPSFGALAGMPNRLRQDAIVLNARLQALELRRMGITVNCSPMIDVRHHESHNIIGDRSFGEEELLVARLGRCVSDAFLAEGVAPIIKHIPGHGRALVDSHEELPLVTAGEEELEKDFYPFRELNDIPLAMTAHIVYSAIDYKRVATLSPTIIQDIIRDKIGFKGLLMTDDVSMKALKGSLKDISSQSLEAGCDLILHCNGKLNEMQEIADCLSDCSQNVLDQTEALEEIFKKEPSFELEEALLQEYQNDFASFIAELVS